MLLKMPFTSHDVDTSANIVKWLKKVMLQLILTILH